MKNYQCSRRIQSSSEADWDLYDCGTQGLVLFSYWKNQKGFDSDRFNSSMQKAVKHSEETTKKKVSVVAGAVKTEKNSVPMEPVYLSGVNQEEFWCVENGLKFRLEVKDVLNPGLFLDQSLNRKKVFDEIEKRKRNGGVVSVLNTFSYTGSFSVYAVAAGADRVDSVDVSQRYLKWEKRNVDENFKDLKSVHRTFVDDARDFMRRRIKKGEKYSTIILDPPTFSRSQGKAFKVQEHFHELLSLAHQLLEVGGFIFASTNDSRWGDSYFYNEMEDFAHEFGYEVEEGSVDPSFPESHPLKSVFLFK